MAAPVWLVYLAAVVAASSLVVTRPTQSALLPALARTPDELTAANAAAGVVEGLGILLGPLLAAVILTRGSVGMVFLAASGFLLLAALGTLRLRPSGGLQAMRRAREDVSDEALVGDDPSFLAGLRTVAADRDARLVVGLLTARMVVIGCADVLFVLLALELLGMGEPGAGLLNAALGAGTIVGGAAAFALIGRNGLAVAAAIGAVLWGVGIAVVGISASAFLAPWCIVLGGAGLTVVDVAGRTILQRSIRDAVLARVFGIQEGLAMAGLATGAVLVSLVSTAAGLAVTIVVVAAVLPIAVALSWRTSSPSTGAGRRRSGPSPCFA